MSTLAISLPEPLYRYVEARAKQVEYSVDEFIAELIAGDQARNEHGQRDLLWELLSISAKQLDDGKGVEFDVERVINEGRERRSQRRG